MATLMAGCASIVTRLPEIDAPALATERTLQQDLALARVDALQTHLMRVADRIRTANADLCARTRPGIGLKTHTLSNYSKTLRPAVARELGAADEPRVLTVVPDSPADLAGIAQGDALIVEGRAVRHGSKAFREALASGRIEVRRDGQVREVAVTPRPECAYDVRLRMSSSINAFATGSSITVTSGMLDFVDGDRELALILGHELAHNTQAHIPKIVRNYVLSLGGTRYARPFESEADYVGLYYMVRAGYAPDGVEAFWRRLALVSPRNTGRAKTHPTTPERFVRIAAARAEIAAKQAAGEVLVPNYLDAAPDAALGAESDAGGGS